MRNKKLIVLFCALFVITLLIFLSSVVFSVQRIEAYCYNQANPASYGKVLENHGIKRNKNIFMLKEDDVILNVETGVPTAKVINIEKKFPNKVIINYIEISEYIKIYTPKQTVICSNDGKILRIEDGKLTDEQLIEVKLKGEVVSPVVGSLLKSSSETDIALFSSVLSSLSRLGYRENVVDLLKEIDISNPSAIMLKTSTGMQWKLLGGEYMLDKLVMALSVYSSNELTADQKREGTLIVFLTSENIIKCQYQPPTVVT